MATWPAPLPKPRKDGYSVKAKTKKARTSMESGPDRVISLSKSYTTEIAVSLLCTKAQEAAFWAFYESEINLGADFFSMAIDTGRGVAVHSVRLVDDPVSSDVGAHKRIAFTLETQDHVA